MNNLSELMQERLNKWRNKALTVPSAEKFRGQTNRATKSDYGDVSTQEEWDEEIRRSQTRK